MFKLFDDDDSDEENISKLSVNNSYAENYEKWRRKEDYQKLKDKYGKDLDSDSDGESSEADLADPDDPEFDMDFFRVLAALRSNHPVVNENKKFFKDSYQSSSKNKKEKEEKPLTIMEYEKKLILERAGKLDEEEGAVAEEQDEIQKGTFRFDDNLSENDDDDLFRLKEKLPKEEKTEDSKEIKKSDAIAFLKGEKRSLTNKLDEELLQNLKKDWQESMSKEEKYIMDYFVNQRYLEDEDEKIDRDPNHHILDVEPFEEDEKTFDKMEEYETKYRFRFEEPDEEFIKRHPRIIKDSFRLKDNKRKDIREKKKQRQMEEEERRKQEKMRYKAWKKQEILEKIEQLRKEAGTEDLPFDEWDLDADFDPEQHDAAMVKMFDEDYYASGSKKDKKPVFENEELNRELEDACKKLEALDEMSEGDFKYMAVIPNSYGLTIEEILFAKDRELNRWYPPKRLVQFGKSEVIEIRDKANFEYRATTHSKMKVLPSLFSDNIEGCWEEEEERKRRKNRKKKERKLKKKMREGLIVDALPTSAKEAERVEEMEVKLPDEFKDQDHENEQKSEPLRIALKKKKKQKAVNPQNAVKNHQNEMNKYNSSTHGKRKRNIKDKKVKKMKLNSENKLEGISEARLLAYGANPKKVLRKLKYGKRYE